MTLQNALGDIALDATLTDGTQKAQLVDAGGVAVDVSAANALKVDGSAVTQPVSGTVAVTGAVTTDALTDAELRAAAVPVSAAALPLPAGAATEATLTDAVGYLNTAATEVTLAAVEAQAGNIAVSTDNIDNTLANHTNYLDGIEGALLAAIDQTPYFEKMKVGTVSGRIAANFMGASMPQDGFTVTATGSGQSVGVDGALNGARYLKTAVAEQTKPETKVNIFQIAEKVFIEAAGPAQDAGTVHGGGRAGGKYFPRFAFLRKALSVTGAPNQSARMIAISVAVKEVRVFGGNQTASEQGVIRISGRRFKQALQPLRRGESVGIEHGHELAGALGQSAIVGRGVTYIFFHPDYGQGSGSIGDFRGTVRAGIIHHDDTRGQNRLCRQVTQTFGQQFAAVIVHDNHGYGHRKPRVIFLKRFFKMYVYSSASACRRNSTDKISVHPPSIFKSCCF